MLEHIIEVKMPNNKEIIIDTLNTLPPDVEWDLENLVFQSCADFTELHTEEEFSEFVLSPTPKLITEKYSEYTTVDSDSNLLKYVVPIEALINNGIKATGLYFITFVYSNRIDGELVWKFITKGVLDWTIVYKEALALMHKANQTCNYSDKASLIDLYWRKESIDMALEIGDWDNAICLYKELLVYLQKCSQIKPGCKPYNTLNGCK